MVNLGEQANFIHDPLYIYKIQFSTSSGKGTKVRKENYIRLHHRGIREILIFIIIFKRLFVLAAFTSWSSPLNTSMQVETRDDVVYQVSTYSQFSSKWK